MEHVRKRHGKSDSLSDAESTSDRSGHSFAIKRSKRDNDDLDDLISFAECSFDIKIVYRNNKNQKELDYANVIKHVVALLNSGGGVIRIDEHKNNKDTITGDRDGWMQALEQKLTTIIPRDQYRQCIHYMSKFPYYYVFVRKSKHVCTQSSGLKLPLFRSVNDANCYDDILRILTRVPNNGPQSESSSLEMSDEDVPDSGYTEDVSESTYTMDDNNSVEKFHHGASVSFEESNTVQFKQIPGGKAHSLDNLLKGIDKHLSNYVSAFANDEGGEIYFGIDDNGKVIGQPIQSESEKSKIEQMVKEIIERKNAKQEMTRIWGKPDFVPKYGEQWTVEFADVIGAPEVRYVIVVKILPFPGGMFLQPPQSWKVDETSEKVVQMKFDEWKKRHILDTGNEDEQKMLKRFEALTLDNFGKRVYQLKNMVKKFAEKVFPATKGLKKVPTNFSEKIKLKNEKESIEKLEKKLHQSYADTYGFVVMDKAWSGNLGIDPAPAEVICDMFVLSFNVMPRMITVARNGSAETREKVRQYNLKLAKTLKLALVNEGGCLECFGIDAQIILLEDINDEMKLPLPISNYPPEYMMRKKVFKKIQESLVILLASFESSSFNPTIGANFLYVLTPEQYNISIKEDRFILVEAPPGTGKTVVAIERIKRLRRNNVKKNEILYICENKPLASFIGSLRISGKSKTEDSKLCLTQTRYGLMSDIEHVGYDEFDNIRHVVVDEAHNFRNENGQDWFNSLLEILKWLNYSKDDDEGTSLYISYDPLQKMRHQDCGLSILDSSCKRQMLSKYSYTKCQLSSVIRNSRKIYQYWKSIALQSGYKYEHIGIAHDYEGSDVHDDIMVSSNAGEEEISSKVKEIIEQILDEKSYKATDIAVLCNTKEDAESLKESLNKCLNICITSAEDFPPRGLVVDSFRRYSGLEAPVVIAVVPGCNNRYENEAEIKVLLLSRAMVDFYLIRKK